MSEWMQWTIFGTTHGADNNSINIFDWIYYFFNDWIICSNDLSTLLFINCILITSVVLFLKSNFIQFSLKNILENEKRFALASGAGLMGLLLIMGFYHYGLYDDVCGNFI